NAPACRKYLPEAGVAARAGGASDGAPPGGRVAISAPNSSDGPCAGAGGVGCTPGSGAGAVAVGPLGGVPAAPSRPYRPWLGSGAWRGSVGAWVRDVSRVARSTNGMGALVT